MTAKQFIARRKELGMTQVALAKALGLSIRQISGMESGERKIGKTVSLAMRSISGGVR